MNFFRLNKFEKNSNKKCSSSEKFPKNIHYGNKEEAHLHMCGQGFLALSLMATTF